MDFILFFAAASALATAPVLGTCFFPTDFALVRGGTGLLGNLFLPSCERVGDGPVSGTCFFPADSALAAVLAIRFFLPGGHLSRRLRAADQDSLVSAEATSLPDCILDSSTFFELLRIRLHALQTQALLTGWQRRAKEQTELHEVCRAEVTGEDLVLARPDGVVPTQARLD